MKTLGTLVFLITCFVSLVISAGTPAPATVPKDEFPITCLSIPATVPKDEFPITWPVCNEQIERLDWAVTNSLWETSSELDNEEVWTFLDIGGFSSAGRKFRSFADFERFATKQGILLLREFKGRIDSSKRIIYRVSRGHADHRTRSGVVGLILTRDIGTIDMVSEQSFDKLNIDFEQTVVRIEGLKNVRVTVGDGTYARTSSIKVVDSYVVFPKEYTSYRRLRIVATTSNGSQTYTQTGERMGPSSLAKSGSEILVYSTPGSDVAVEATEDLNDPKGWYEISRINWSQNSGEESVLPQASRAGKPQSSSDTNTVSRFFRVRSW